MTFVFSILLFLLGLCFGSFLCCQARRLHLRAERQSSPKSRPKSPKSQARTKSPQSLPSRSVCLHCGHQLRWYENIPLISWLALKGKCRKCHHKIGLAEPLAELLTAMSWLALGLAFLAQASFDLSLLRPLDWSIFIVTLVLTLPLIFLALYDGLYGELPTLILILAIVLALVVLILKAVAYLYPALSISPAPFALLTNESVYANIILSPLSAAVILSGIYLFLYLVSKGQWVGDGDWLLALALALALANPWLALVALFVTNALATLISLPFLKRLKAHKIHLGPFLVAAFIIVTICSTSLLQIVL